MGIPKVCGFLAMNVLPFILLIDSSVDMFLVSPYAYYGQQYCKHEIAIKGTYQNPWKKATPIVTFKITKVFMGPSDMTEVIKINAADCSYHPKAVNTNEFFVLADRKNGEIVCSSHKPWLSLDAEEIYTLNRIARNGCKRESVPSSS